MKDEIVLYRPDKLAQHIEVSLDDETVWLNRNQIASCLAEIKNHQQAQP